MIHPDILTGRLGNRMFQIAYLYTQVKDGVIPDWYVQDPKYFEKYASDIRQLFGEEIKPLPYVAIHIRRGKNPINPNESAYSENSFYVNLADDTDYYQKAVQLFPHEEFLVFSDDNKYAEQWAKENLNNWTLDNSNNAVDALNKMAGCRGIIMANSSLSWWASYLGSSYKKVVYPSEWFFDGVQRVGFLESWEKILSTTKFKNAIQL